MLRPLEYGEAQTNAALGQPGISSAAKAGIENMAVIAAVNRCATQKPSVGGGE